MCYTQICPCFECRDEHTIHTCVYCVLTLNAGPGRGVCVCVSAFVYVSHYGKLPSSNWFCHADSHTSIVLPTQLLHLCMFLTMANCPVPTGFAMLTHILPLSFWLNCCICVCFSLWQTAQFQLVLPCWLTYFHCPSDSIAVFVYVSHYGTLPSSNWFCHADSHTSIVLLTRLLYLCMFLTMAHGPVPTGFAMLTHILPLSFRLNCCICVCFSLWQTVQFQLVLPCWLTYFHCPSDSIAAFVYVSHYGTLPSSNLFCHADSHTSIVPLTRLLHLCMFLTMAHCPVPTGFAMLTHILPLSFWLNCCICVCFSLWHTAQFQLVLPCWLTYFHYPSYSIAVFVYVSHYGTLPSSNWFCHADSHTSIVPLTQLLYLCMFLTMAHCPVPKRFCHADSHTSIVLLTRLLYLCMFLTMAHCPVPTGFAMLTHILPLSFWLDCCICVCFSLWHTAQFQLVLSCWLTYSHCPSYSIAVFVYVSHYGTLPSSNWFCHADSHTSIVPLTQLLYLCMFLTMAHCPVPKRFCHADSHTSIVLLTRLLYLCMFFTMAHCPVPTGFAMLTHLLPLSFWLDCCICVCFSLWHTAQFQLVLSCWLTYFHCPSYSIAVFVYVSHYGTLPSSNWFCHADSHTPIVLLTRLLYLCMFLTMAHCPVPTGFAMLTHILPLSFWLDCCICMLNHWCCTKLLRVILTLSLWNIINLKFWLM